MSFPFPIPTTPAATSAPSAHTLNLLRRTLQTHNTLISLLTPLIPAKPPPHAPPAPPPDAATMALLRQGVRNMQQLGDGMARLMRGGDFSRVGVADGDGEADGEGEREGEGKRDGEAIGAAVRLAAARRGVLTAAVEGLERAGSAASPSRFAPEIRVVIFYCSEQKSVDGRIPVLPLAIEVLLRNALDAGTGYWNLHPSCTQRPLVAKPITRTPIPRQSLPAVSPPHSHPPFAMPCNTYLHSIFCSTCCCPRPAAAQPPVATHPTISRPMPISTHLPLHEAATKGQRGTTSQPRASHHTSSHAPTPLATADVPDTPTPASTPASASAASTSSPPATRIPRYTIAPLPPLPLPLASRVEAFQKRMKRLSERIAWFARDRTHGGTRSPATAIPEVQRARDRMREVLRAEVDAVEEAEWGVGEGLIRDLGFEGVEEWRVEAGRRRRQFWGALMPREGGGGDVGDGN
ncbi:hypothetical protein EDC01DRAFT_784476 [Geopyxis carbonaria]|nr:hypothetical protein EDC01DRAFT_784476 [Geopyxis carbonaria]